MCLENGISQGILQVLGVPRERNKPRHSPGTVLGVPGERNKPRNSPGTVLGVPGERNNPRHSPGTRCAWRTE